MIKIRVDGREITAEEGTALLQACLESGMYIPNLCHLPGMKEPHASCRLCFVELGGEAQPVPSCTVTVTEGLEVRTDSPRVRDLQKTALRLLLSVHQVDCGHCPANKRCELQKIAKFLGVGLKPKGLDQYLKEPDVVKEHRLIDYYPNRCVLCARCVRTCLSGNGRVMMTFARRGFDTLISFYGADDGEPPACEECHACVEVCPVAAITFRNQPV